MTQEKKTIEIVDRGRGLQLSTHRVTVQDLVPYFQDGSSHDEILRWIPSLSREEIQVVETYYRAHQAECDEQDRRIRERSSARKNPDWVEAIMERGRIKMRAIMEELKSQQKNGAAE